MHFQHVGWGIITAIPRIGMVLIAVGLAIGAISGYGIGTTAHQTDVHSDHSASQIPLTVVTDKASYQFGETVTLKGTAEKSWVSFVVLDSNGKVWIDGVNSTLSDGTYSWSPLSTIPSGHPTGTWSVEVIQDSGPNARAAKTTFVVEAPTSFPQLELPEFDEC
ncbi:MAG: hypothetical protein ACE5PO_00495 [Candidatus Bathyarchaeia archaeon]